MATKEIELTEYEHKRLKELTDVLGQLDGKLKAFAMQIRQLSNLRQELAGRRAELVEMLANKYEFDPKAKFSLNEKKLILEDDSGQ